MTSGHDAFDVVVVGSGAAGLTAAIVAHDAGRRVAIAEKASMVGGTSAVSGGVVWAPNNHKMRAAGLDDSPEEALAYASHLARVRAPDPTLLDVYVRSAAEAVRYLEDHTPVRWAIVENFADYYGGDDVPGRRNVGRALEPLPFPVGEQLSDWRGRIASRSSLRSMSLLKTLTEDLTSTPGASLDDEISRREHADVRAKGAGLVAALFRGVLDRGIVVKLDCRATELLADDRGAIRGVRCDHAGDAVDLLAAHAVVLATGGFEWNRELTRGFVGYEVMPLSPPSNEGDGLLMAMRAGALLGNMSSYWGQTAMISPEIAENGRAIPQFGEGIGAPSSILVNRAGRRFVSEALPYHDLPKAFAAFDPARPGYPNESPGWLVFDAKVRATVRVGPIEPDDPDPGWLARSSTVAGLADAIGVPADTLCDTVDRYNRCAKNGVDDDFRRHLGHGAKRRMAPLDTPCFYAIEVHPGTFGTNGGPRTDKDARVLDAHGGIVPNLYAVGNVAANVFGSAYPAGGSTLGSGVTFAYRAGRHIGALGCEGAV